MKRDTLVALIAALLLHAGFFWGGAFFKNAATPPPTAVLDEPIPVIELLPLSAEDSAPANTPLASFGGMAEADLPALPTAAAAELKSTVIVAPSLQSIQPPALPGLHARGGGIAMPSGLAGAEGFGVGRGLGNLFNLADLDHPPVPTLRVPPNYPYEMRRAGLSGEVVVGFIVDTTGHVRDAYAVRSSQREFTDEAVRAILKWQFKPGQKSGVPVNTRMQVPLVFNLAPN